MVDSPQMLLCQERQKTSTNIQIHENKINIKKYVNRTDSIIILELQFAIPSQAVARANRAIKNVKKEEKSKQWFQYSFAILHLFTHLFTQLLFAQA